MEQFELGEIRCRLVIRLMGLEKLYTCVIMLGARNSCRTLGGRGEELMFASGLVAAGSAVSSLNESVISLQFEACVVFFLKGVKRLNPLFIRVQWI